MSCDVVPDWAEQPESEELLSRVLKNIFGQSRAIQLYANRLHDSCAVRLRDIIDHIEFCDEAFVHDLEGAGWVCSLANLWENPLGNFPKFVLGEKRQALVVRVESVDTFLSTVGSDAPVSGERGAPVRRASVPGVIIGFDAIERNGGSGFDGAVIEPDRLRAANYHLQIFRSRRRQFDGSADGLVQTRSIVDSAVEDIGAHHACALWLSAERDYWMMRCPAARLQKRRQDGAGIGWSNVDHHTYDASREHFAGTIGILERLGYVRRELMYAGDLAGWGSQILEQPVLNSTIFADVDLAPHELGIDFANDRLPPLSRHRRAGLVCALHGESMLEAGLNHVAGLYDSRRLRAQLAFENVAFMPPFSDMPHLYQELTVGVRVPVDPRRVDELCRLGHLRADDAEDIRTNGAILSHLENIERNNGYKGFNKPGIDGVLRKLDPRAQDRAIEDLAR